MVTEIAEMRAILLAAAKVAKMEVSKAVHSVSWMAAERAEMRAV